MSTSESPSTSLSKLARSPESSNETYAINLPFHDAREAATCLQQLGILSRFLNCTDVTSFIRQIARGDIHCIRSDHFNSITDDKDIDDIETLQQVILVQKHENAMLRERVQNEVQIDPQLYLTVYFGRTHPPYLIPFGDSHGILADTKEMKRELFTMGGPDAELFVLQDNGKAVSFRDDSYALQCLLNSSKRRVIVTKNDYSFAKYANHEDQHSGCGFTSQHASTSTAEQGSAHTPCACPIMVQPFLGISKISNNIVSWRATLDLADQSINLGIFPSAHCAAHARDTALFSYLQYTQFHNEKSKPPNIIRYNFRTIFIPTQAAFGQFDNVCESLRRLHPDTNQTLYRSIPDPFSPSMPNSNIPTSHTLLSPMTTSPEYSLNRLAHGSPESVMTHTAGNQTNAITGSSSETNKHIKTETNTAVGSGTKTIVGSGTNTVVESETYTTIHNETNSSTISKLNNSTIDIESNTTTGLETNTITRLEPNTSMGSETNKSSGNASSIENKSPMSDSSAISLNLRRSARRKTPPKTILQVHNDVSSPSNWHTTSSPRDMVLVLHDTGSSVDQSTTSATSSTYSSSTIDPNDHDSTCKVNGTEPEGRRRMVKTSRYRGVKFCKKSCKYIASIQIDGRAKRLGVFTNEVDAAHAYDAEARRLNAEQPNRHSRRTFRPNFAEDGTRLPYTKKRHATRRGPLLVEDVSVYKQQKLASTAYRTKVQ